VAAFYLPKLPQSLLDPAMALPYHLYIISTQIPNIRVDYRYGTALVLVLIVLVVNISATIIRAKHRRKR
jgi:phosphate transport system permease protein